jgi:hypothetical protein
MWPADARARVAAAAAAEQAARQRLTAAGHSIRASTGSAIASPVGLAMAFAAGLLAAPAAAGLARSVRSSRNIATLLGTVGLRPRDLIAGLRAARQFFAPPVATGTPPADSAAAGAGARARRPAHGGVSPSGASPGPRPGSDPAPLT